MALEFGGIDSKINDKADAYRNNPQQLQKRYGQNKQLVDLLALQKITTEKKEVAMNMALAAEGNPNTIADQRQQEALELTKKEMQGTLGELTGRTKDTLGQKQVEQKKGMQRIAKGAGKPPQGGLGALVGQGRPAAPPTSNPQMQGLAGARMAQAQAQQRGGPVRMAQGGIVGYAEGDLITLTDKQKARARQLFPNAGEAESYIARIEGLPNNDDSAMSLLALVDTEPGDGQSTPAGRAFAKVGAKLGDFSANQALQKKVYDKYGPYATPIFGAFKAQSPEEQAYAQKVMSNYGDLSAQQLQALLDAPFVGAGKTDMSAMPDVTTAAAVPAVGGESIDPFAAPALSPITYEQNDGYQTNVSQLPTNVFNVQPTTPTAVSNAAVTAAENSLIAGFGETPAAREITDVKKAELAPVPAAEYMNETGLMARNKLLTRAGEDFNIDVDAEIDAARDSADTYTMRNAKNAMYRQQVADEKAFQGRVLDPARVEQLKRMETYGGGAKYGRGGIGQAYAESERRYDDIEGGGLKTLRGIQDNATTNDFNMVGYGMGAGSRAGAGARADKLNAGVIYGDEMNRQKTAAETQRTINQGINTANAAAQNDAFNQKYAAELQAIRSESIARGKLLDTKVAERSNLTDMSIAQAQAITDTEVANADALLRQAIASDKNALEFEKLRQNDEEAAKTLFYEQSDALTANYRKVVDEDPIVLKLREMLEEGQDTETQAQLDDITLRIEMERARVEARVAERFIKAFAKLHVLKAHADNLAAQRLASQSSLGEVDSNDDSVQVVPAGQD